MCEILKFCVLFLTLLAVIWYANETRKLRIETVKQTRLSMRPIVVVTYDEGERKFMLMNYGNTPAFHIKIDDVSLKGLKHSYVFPEEYCVPHSKKISIKNIKIKRNGEVLDTHTFELGAIIPSSAPRTLDIKIRYKNAESEKYITEGKVGKDMFDITKIEKIS